MVDYEIFDDGLKRATGFSHSSLHRRWPLWMVKVYTRVPEMCLYVRFWSFSKAKVIAKAKRWHGIEWRPLVSNAELLKRTRGDIPSPITGKPS